jgi:uncharacterized protein (TIGR02001 family)
MKIPFKGLVAAGLLLTSGLAHAQLSSTWTLTNDYDFRGFSQSAKDPAIQGSLDYAFSQGFTLGAWASNVDFDNDADVELDLYANYTGKISESAAWTAGLTWYLYPGSDDVKDYPEIFVGFNWNAIQFKQWYSNDYLGLDESAWYTEGNATFPLPANFSLLAHVGYSWGDAWDDLGGELFDYSLGVGYALGKFNLSLKWTGTDASGTQKITSDVGNNEGRVVFAVATTFPW